jgi:hypothetical protein
MHHLLEKLGTLYFYHTLGHFGNLIRNSWHGWQELHCGNGQTMGCETHRTQAILGSRSFGKIQTSTAFV